MYSFFGRNYGIFEESKLESVRMGTNMNFKIIDLEKYKRKEHFLHYLNNVPCFYSMTANIDITDLQKYIKEKEYKLYPVLIYVSVG